MRLVLDTNILVSALISKIAAPNALLEGWKRGMFQLCTCEEQIVELRRVFSYGKLQRFVSVEQAKLIVEEVAERASLGDVKKVLVSQDPDDDVIVGCAVAARADYLVTGDKRDLLSLGEVEGVKIVSARSMVALLKLS